MPFTSVPFTSAALPPTPTSPNIAVAPGRAPVRRPVLPRPAPVHPGARLRAAVESVLIGLRGDRVDLADARQRLVVGLAWTAATGETCQLVPQVEGVRAAIAAADAETAAATLARVLDLLPQGPALPVPRPSVDSN